MNKYTVIGGAVAVMAMGSLALSADEGGAKKSGTPAMRKSSSADTPADRKLELRVGPRISFLTGDLRTGKTGTTFDIWDDLALDEPSGGVQFDIDWQPLDRWHVAFGMTGDQYDHSGTTSKNISNGEDVLVSGASVSADLGLYTFEGKLGYDAIKNDTWRIQPYIGGKGAWADGTATVTGAVLNSAGVTVATSRTKTTRLDQSYGLFFGGVDARAYISHQWYVGADIGAFGLDSWYYLTGDAYTGYDFSKTWGIRAGYAYDYVSWENNVKSGQAEPLLGAAYVQAVWGF